jgi:hypothetical protein
MGDRDTTLFEMAEGMIQGRDIFNTAMTFIFLKRIFVLGK